MSERPYDGFARFLDDKADDEVKKMTTPHRPTCKVCMADLANSEPHESWCTLKEGEGS